MNASSSALPFSANAAWSDDLRRLKSAPRRQGEASFFWYETYFQSIAVKVLPGEYFVDGRGDAGPPQGSLHPLGGPGASQGWGQSNIMIMTTLGSCIAACIWDRDASIGGLNHFMLPEGAADDGRYGSFAMEVLINELLKRGASRLTLEAKVFGGGQVIAGMDTLNVGARNTAFVLDYLKTEHIPVVSKDVLDIYPRKVCFIPSTGKAMVKRLAPTNAAALLAREKAASQRVQSSASAGGSVDLFYSSE